MFRNTWDFNVRDNSRYLILFLQLSIDHLEAPYTPQGYLFDRRKPKPQGGLSLIFSVYHDISLGHKKSSRELVARYVTQYTHFYR